MTILNETFRKAFLELGSIVVVLRLQIGKLLVQRFVVACGLFEVRNVLVAGGDLFLETVTLGCERGNGFVTLCDNGLLRIHVITIHGHHLVYLFIGQSELPQVFSLHVKFLLRYALITLVASAFVLRITFRRSYYFNGRCRRNHKGIKKPHPCSGHGYWLLYQHS